MSRLREPRAEVDVPIRWWRADIDLSAVSKALASTIGQASAWSESPVASFSERPRHDLRSWPFRSASRPRAVRSSWSLTLLTPQPSLGRRELSAGGSRVTTLCPVLRRAAARRVQFDRLTACLRVRSAAAREMPPKSCRLTTQVDAPPSATTPTLYFLARRLALALARLDELTAKLQPN